MGKIPSSPFFFEVWKDGLYRFVRREAGRFVRIITDYSSDFEVWKDGNRRRVARDSKGRFIKWRLEPIPAYEEELEEEVEEELEEEVEEELEEEEPRDLFRQTIALRGVKHSEYFNIVAHYYGLSESDAEAHIPELMKRVLKEMHKVAGYHNANTEDFRISDIARIPYEQDLLGEIELEEEWDL